MSTSSRLNDVIFGMVNVSLILPLFPTRVNPPVPAIERPFKDSMHPADTKRSVSMILRLFIHSKNNTVHQFAADKNKDSDFNLNNISLIQRIFKEEIEDSTIL